MSQIKNLLFNKLSEMGVENPDDYVIEAAMREMNQIMEQHSLPDYVVLTNKQRCYLGDDCDPVNDSCYCNG